MAHHLRPLEDQVIVLTGASSGIGLVTARMAAQRGARLVLAARSEDALRQLAEEINQSGGEAIAITCDVGNEEDVQRVHDAAIDRFGGYDTWVNDAAIGMYGRLLDTPLADMKRLFDTNLWGMVHGSLTAARHFRDRGDARFDGTIINIGSVLSYQAVPLQGVYTASKHAVKGFTDSLRMEMEHDKVPVSVTCIMPNSIDTPYAQHAPNYLGNEASLPPPLYTPEVVARSILHACTHPTRDLTVGGSFKPLTALNNVLPGVVDAVMSAFMYPAQQKRDQPIASRESRALTAASSAVEGGSLHERSGDSRFTQPFSAYTEARMHPLATTALLAGAGLLVGALVNAKRNHDDY